MTLVAVRGFPSRPGAARPGCGAFPAADRLGLAAYLAAIVLYVLIAALALVGGGYALRTEAVLQTILVFLGFNIAWLLLLTLAGAVANIVLAYRVYRATMH